MKALILAGGLATRLKPLSDTLPKSLWPIANRPFLEHQIRLLASHGIKECTLLTGYLAEYFDGFVRAVEELGVRLDISTETEPLGTAGAVRSRLDELDGPMLVFNGDVITGVDLGALIARHDESGAAVTLYLRPVADASAFGLVPLDDDGRVLEFLEKPPPEVARGGGLINAGIYVLDPRVLERVPPRTFWQFEQNLFPELLTAGEPLVGFPAEDYWIDIGNRERYLQAHRDAVDGISPVLVEGRLVGATEQTETRASVGASIVGDPVLIGPRATVGPYSCIGDACMIGAEAVVERSVLHPGARVGVGARVSDSILGSGVMIPMNARVQAEIVA